jgi:hypothetical protein
MENRRHLIGFVRHTLGCQCPDRVFEEIACRDLETPGNTGVRSVTLGGRLLLYVWKTDDVLLIKSILPAILSQGRKERDRRGLNRFRAVIATYDVYRMEPVAQKLFQDFSHKDDKVHLHVVHVDDVANLW